MRHSERFALWSLGLANAAKHSQNEDKVKKGHVRSLVFCRLPNFNYNYLETVVGKAGHWVCFVYGFRQLTTALCAQFLEPSTMSACSLQRLWLRVENFLKMGFYKTNYQFQTFN